MEALASEHLLFVVDSAEQGMRLDRFLASRLAANSPLGMKPLPLLPFFPSRTELRRWIEGGFVTMEIKNDPRRVTEVISSPSAKLRAGAYVQVRPPEPLLSQAKPEQGIHFDVLYMDDDVIVIMKPAGLVVHPAAGNASGTLVNGLLGRGLFDGVDLDALGGGEQACLRPGIVHRLDKGTSGVMVVAKHPYAREHLKLQFQKHTIERSYVAVVMGDVGPCHISTLHGRHLRDRFKFSTLVKNGKPAVTCVEVLSKAVIAEKNEEMPIGGVSSKELPPLPVLSYVRCTLKTGRTHQIRVHLSECLGAAILGDPLYAHIPKNKTLRALHLDLGHQALHAGRLGFIHPRTNEKMVFCADVPPDFRCILTQFSLG